MKEIKKVEKKGWNKSISAILVSEFLGTIALTLWIILPSTMAFTTPAAHQNNQDFWIAWSNIWSLMFMKALWAALFVVFIVYLLRFISVNLNPAVTIAEIGYGNDTLKIGSLKIGAQILGGISAGFFAYLISDSMGLWNSADNAASYQTSLDAVYPVWTSYNWGDIDYNTALYATKSYDEMDLGGLFVTVSFFLEILYTGILIGGVFLFKNVTHFWRPIVVGVGVWLAVTLGIRSANISINPARMMGPAIAHDVMSSVTGVNGDVMYTIWIPFYLIAQIIAGLSFAFYGRKQINKKIVNNKLAPMIS
ncbi:MAG: hypothetical protein HPAVJP_3820 [Candidatus Hepatoplasma vulgare]|nr:MAG: hypothetical protein HPAVJP_3820 [Candidatus Hepatoplasma sp.]